MSYNGLSGSSSNFPKIFGAIQAGDKMKEILSQVSRARRRVLTGQFFDNLILALFIGLLAALVGLTLPKIRPWEFLSTEQSLLRWNYSWVIGGVMLALIMAVIKTAHQASSHLLIATEVDRRFALNERLSSALCLSHEDLQSPAGQALLEDAVGSASTIDVRDEFRFQPTAKAALPLLPCAGLFLLMLIPNAMQPEVPVAATEKVPHQELQLIIEEARKEKEKRKEDVAKGLKDDKPDVKLLEQKFDALLNDKNLDKKTALAKLNDIKKEIENRKSELGDPQELKDNLNRLKDVAKGPAKRLSKSLGEGDMNEAQQAIKQLAEKLRDGKLSEVEKKQLAVDLEAMAEELQKAIEQQKEERQKLEEQMKQALEKGDLDKAAQLQDKIDQNEKKMKQQEKLEQLAQQLQDCAQCMKGENNGQPKPGGGQQQAESDAADTLDEIADMLEQMQADLEDIEDLEELEQLAGDCKACLGGLAGEDREGAARGGKDWGIGTDPDARGREIGEDETGGFRARQRATLQQGERIMVGTADGENIAGRTSEEIRQLVEIGMGVETDPLENQRLPRAQRDHAQQYFDALRTNR